MKLDKLEKNQYHFKLYNMVLFKLYNNNCSLFAGLIYFLQIGIPEGIMFGKKKVRKNK